MAKHTVEESLTKIQTLKKILRDEIERDKAITDRELKAIHEAIRIEKRQLEKSKEHKIEKELKRKRPAL